MEKKYDAQLKIVFDAIRQLMIPPAPKEKNRIPGEGSPRRLCRAQAEKMIWMRFAEERD
jgi:hypothetical protein